MKTIHISYWDEFVHCINDYSGWAFRGEPHADWPLLTSLARRLQRYCPDEDLWPLRETRAMRVFARKAHIHLGDELFATDVLRSLALMQHHGAPTRLLDFSKSPYVAAFFALESAISDGSVYGLNTPALWSQAPLQFPDLDRDTIDPRVGTNFERYFLPNQFPVIWFGEPSKMDNRLVAQSGMFVVPGQLNKPLEAMLNDYASEEDLLVKFVLPQGIRTEALNALYRMNVTYATLFPDLDGLARASAFELEAVWDRLVDDFHQGKKKPLI